MTMQLLIAYAVLWATLLKALLVRARVIPAAVRALRQARSSGASSAAVCTCDPLRAAPS